MAAIALKEETLKSLHGKVVVITGSAKGIGAATVSQLYASGAKVIHGDWDEAGQKLDAQLPTTFPSSVAKTHFVRTDVTSYESLLNLFHVAWEKYARIDIAISNAGILEVGNWFDPSLDLESVKTKPSNKTVDVNLTGTLYFARIAAVYMHQNAGPHDNKSLVLLSSTAGFKDTPGLFCYTAAKHGVLGLVRSLRSTLPKTHNIRVNAICPWATDTGMAIGVREVFVENGLALNTAGDIGRVILEVGNDGVSNGKAVFVEGGRGWDIEVGINMTEPQWLGEEVSRNLEKGQQLLGLGTAWTKLDA